MINDRIRHIAQGLADLDMDFESKDLHAAMRGSNPPETLRAVFLSLKMMNGVGGATHNFVKELLERLPENDGIPDAQTQLLMDILEDADMIAPAERPQAWDALVDRQHVADMVKFETLTAMIDRMWAPKLRGSEAARMWSEVVLSEDDEQADRLLARTDADGLPLREAIFGVAVKNVRALDLLVQRMSDESVEREIRALLARIDEDPGSADKALNDALAVLGAHYVRRFGVQDGFAAQLMAIVMEHGDSGVRAGEHFAELALATGLYKEPDFFHALRGTEARRVSATSLRKLLASGVPASKADRRGMVHLLEEPADDQCAILWEHMDAKQREHYLKVTLPSQLAYFHHEWQRRFASVLRGNPLVWLHQAGIDLGQSRRYGGSRVVPLHETNEVRDEDVLKWVFLTLHAVGAYDKYARYGGLTALHLAAQMNDAPAITALVKLGHDVNAMSFGRPGTKEGETALITAARAGHEGAVRALLEAGADTGIKTNSGRALSQVTRNESIRRLINSVRSANAVNRAMPEGEVQRVARPSDMGAIL